MKKDYTPLICDDCGIEIFWNFNMVMLHDDLWREISDDIFDSYCDCCIEKRLGRPISPKDFRTVNGQALCNITWWELKLINNN